MIGYAGGEPYVYPEIVAGILQTFSEYWMRITTNGLLLTEYDIHLLKTHGKACLGISLDGGQFRKTATALGNRGSIDSGMLTLPAHLMTIYGHMHREAAAEQMKQLQKQLDGMDLSVCRKIWEHYRAMFCPERGGIYRWSASMHFLNRAIVQEGIFVSYQCGMRSIEWLSEFCVTAVWHPLELDRYVLAAAHTEPLRPGGVVQEVLCA